MGNERGAGHSGQVGYGGSGNDDGNGKHRVGPVHQPVGHDGGHAEIGSVRQSGQKTGRKHHVIVLGRGCQRIARDIQAHERQQDAPEGARADRQHHERRARAYAKGICGDKVPGIGDADPQRTRDIGQYSHDGEFGHADAQCAEGQGGKTLENGVADFHQMLCRCSV